MPQDVTAFDAFHLLYATLLRAELWSWDGSTFTHAELSPSDHVLVNAGPDVDSAVVSTGRALLHALPSPDWPEVSVAGSLEAWGPWVTPLEVEPSGEAGRLLVRHELDGRTYGSSSVALVALGSAGVRYDFSAVPAGAHTWSRILPS